MALQSLGVGCPKWKECDWWIVKARESGSAQGCPDCPECLSKRITVVLNYSPKCRSRESRITIESWKLKIIKTGKEKAKTKDIVLNYSPKCRSLASKMIWKREKLKARKARKVEKYKQPCSMAIQSLGVETELKVESWKLKTRNGWKDYRRKREKLKNISSPVQRLSKVSESDVQNGYKTEKRCAEQDSKTSESGVQNGFVVVPSVSDGDVQNKRGMCPEWARGCLKTC